MVRFEKLLVRLGKEFVRLTWLRLVIIKCEVLLTFIITARFIYHRIFIFTFISIIIFGFLVLRLISPMNQIINYSILSIFIYLEN